MAVSSSGGRDHEGLRSGTARRVVGAGLLACGIAYAWFASSTRSFTAGAEIATAIPLGLLVGGAVLQSRLGNPFPIERVDRPPRTGIVGRWQDPRARAGMVAWGLLVPLSVMWELFNYFQSDRHQHPTVSSFLDTVSLHHWSKAVLYLGWLLLGWFLLRR